MKVTVTLSRRNLLTLLSKLDRKSAGEDTACTLIKYDGRVEMGRETARADVFVVAAEDSDVYKDREPGVVHPKDEPK